VKKQQKQTPDAFKEALQSSIQGTRHASKFIAGFVIALLKVRSSNLAKVAVAVETKAEVSSTYRQIQRFLATAKKVEVAFLALMNITGKVTLAIDRTEWKFGQVWINILTVSVVYKQVAVPVLWQVAGQKGNATAFEHIKIIKEFIAKFGKERIEKILGDREFGSQELFKFLIDEEIDFLIRLKVSHLADGISFKKRWRDLSERVKLTGNRAVEVFGLESYVSVVKLKKGKKSEYLIVASRQPSNQALAEYKLRWRIETMFGCLKSRGFELEETHLTNPRKISKLMLMLALALCLAMLMGEIQVEQLKRVSLKLKNNGRYEKSLFRIGLDALQNILFNLKIPDKRRCFNILVNLLSCAYVN